MASNSRYRLKFSEHLNTRWVSEDCEIVSSKPDFVSKNLFSRLTENKELIINNPQAIHLKGPNLPDFESEPQSLEEQEEWVKSLLCSQLALAEIVCGRSRFAEQLKKRQVILERIYHAINRTFHTGAGDSTTNFEKLNYNEENKVEEVHLKTGNEALIEMGVKTGLSLMFTLFRQNWALAERFGILGLCGDVLQTALETVRSLPPLTLANESKLTTLGIQSLNQTTNFLKSIASPKSGADVNSRKFAVELILALAAQRGSLKSLLEWVELAMLTPVSQKEDKASYKISLKFFHDVVTEMMTAAVSLPQMSRLMTKPAKWHVHPAKNQISLGIHPVWSQFSLCAEWVAKDPSFLHVGSEDWSYWADAEADHFVGFIIRQLRCPEKKMDIIN